MFQVLNDRDDERLFIFIMVSL